MCHRVSAYSIQCLLYPTTSEARVTAESCAASLPLDVAIGKVRFAKGIKPHDMNGTARDGAEGCRPLYAYGLTYQSTGFPYRSVSDEDLSIRGPASRRVRSPSRTRSTPRMGSGRCMTCRWHLAPRDFLPFPTSIVAICTLWTTPRISSGRLSREIDTTDTHFSDLTRPQGCLRVPFSTY